MKSACNSDDQDIIRTMIEAMLSILMKRGCSEYLEIALSGWMNDSSVTMLHARDLRDLALI